MARGKWVVNKQKAAESLDERRRKKEQQEKTIRDKELIRRFDSAQTDAQVLLVFDSIMTRMNWDDTKEPTTLNDLFNTVLMMVDDDDDDAMRYSTDEVAVVATIEKEIGEARSDYWMDLDMLANDEGYKPLEKNDAQRAYIDAIIDIQTYIKFPDLRADVVEVIIKEEFIVSLDPVFRNP